MSWLSETLHGHFNNPLAYGLGGAAALAGGAFLLPELAGAVGLGGAAEAGALGAEAGAGALGTATEVGGNIGLDALAGAGDLGGLGSEVTALAPTAGDFGWGGTGLDAFTGTGAGGWPGTLNDAGFNSFYGATGAPGGVEAAVAGAPATSSLGYLPETGLVPQSTIDPMLGTVPGAETSAGAPFANSPAGANALTDAGKTGGSFWDQLVGGAKSSLTRNPLGIAAGAGMLGYNMLQGSRTSANVKNISAQASQLGAQGQQLMQYLQSGTLPPGLQAGINNAKAAMTARIMANHAHNGMSTNPAENSALAAELNNLDMQVFAAVAAQGEKLLTMGIDESKISADLYTTLERLQRDQSASMGRAIATFAAALGGNPMRIAA
jgi:hypothetical protein